MATYYSGYSNGYRLRLEINQKAQSIENNTTTLTYALYLQNGGSYFQNYSIAGSYLNINGQRKWNGSSNFSLAGMNRSTLLTSGTMTIDHNNDGTKIVPLAAYFTVGGSAYYLPGNLSLNANMTLISIPRATTITAVSNISTNSTGITIVLDKKHNSYWHYIRISKGGTWVTEFSDKNSTNFTGQKTLQLTATDINRILEAMPTKTTDMFYLDVYTYKDESLSVESLIGENSKAFIVSVDNSQVPTIKLHKITTKTPLKNGDITDLLLSVGEVYFDFTATTAKGTTLKEKSVRFAGSGGTYGISTGRTTNSAPIKPAKTGQQELIIRLVDSRNRTAEYKQTYTVHDYSPISAREIFIGRTRNTNNSKSYMDVEADITTSSIKPSDTELNTVMVTVGYKERNANTDYEIIATYTGIAAQTWRINKTPSMNFLLEKAYDLEIIASDQLSSVVMYRVLSTADYTLVMGKNVVGVNMFPTISKGFQVNGNIYDGENGSRNLSKQFDNILNPRRVIQKKNGHGEDYISLFISPPSGYTNDHFDWVFTSAGMLAPYSVQRTSGGLLMHFGKLGGGNISSSQYVEVMIDFYKR